MIVPAGYDGTQKVPLVEGVHGGLMTGWGHAIYTSWTLAAVETALSACSQTRTPSGGDVEASLITGSE